MAEIPVWIHIGLGKTGTTTLQRKVFSRHSEILYLGKNFTDNDMAAAALLSLVRQPPQRFDMAQTRAAFAAMFDDAARGTTRKRVALLSEEDLSTYRFLDPAITAARVKEIFPQAKILLVIREPLQWLQSMYYFRLSLRFPEALGGFAEWVRTSLARPPVGTDVGQLYAGQVARHYAEAYGKENVKVMFYEDFRADGEAFVSAICGDFGIGVEEALRLYRADSDKVFEKSRITQRQENFLKQYKLVAEGRYAEYVAAAAPLLDAVPSAARQHVKSLLPSDLSLDKSLVVQQLRAFSVALDRGARQYLQEGERASAEIDDQLRHQIGRIAEIGLRYIGETFDVRAVDYLKSVPFSPKKGDGQRLIAGVAQPAAAAAGKRMRNPPEASSDPWFKLLRELDQWRREGLSVLFWWRDDDAVSVTPALQRLIDISSRYSVPVGLSVIPEGAETRLASELARRPLISVLQHGIAHVSHRESPGIPNIELGGTRPLKELMEGLTGANERMKAMFGGGFLPILVPPWNNIDPKLVGHLPALGFRGLSTAGQRRKRVDGLVESNGHVNPINWAGGAHFAGSEESLDQAWRQLQSRRIGQADRNEPVGLLTHHLATDEDTWTFVECFVAFTRGHPAVKWVDPADAFSLN